ncbi:MAG: hypothetical protein LC641_07375, partial [Spirochaeta sp.]|nr:hypothetical protein [Spirochaeta sp.]
VSTGDGDPATVFVRAFSAFPDYTLQFSDALSSGKLIMRLGDLNVFDTHSVSFTNLVDTASPSEKTLVFSLVPDDQERVWAKLQSGPDTQTQQLKAPPYTMELKSPRVRRYYSEQALHAWARMLQALGEGPSRRISDRAFERP